MQKCSWTRLDDSTQSTTEWLSPESSSSVPSTSQQTVVDQDWPQQLTVQGSQTTEDSSFCHSQLSLRSPPVALASPQRSTRDRDPAGVKENEQQREVDVASISSVLDSAVSEPASPQSSTMYGDYLPQAEIVSSTGVLIDESSFHAVGSSAHVLSEDVPPSRPASPMQRRESGGDQHQNLVLDAIDSTFGLASCDAWLCGTDQQFGDDRDTDVCVPADDVSEQCVDTGILALTSPLWQQNFWITTDTESNLTVHYFNNICQIMSCFDSRQNPFRKDIPRIMFTCECLKQCVNALSAAHLANSICGMDSIAIRYQTKAIRGLMSVLQTLQYSSQNKSSDNGLSRLSDTFVRHQALLVALLLAISAVRTNFKYRTTSPD